MTKQQDKPGCIQWHDAACVFPCLVTSILHQVCCSCVQPHLHFGLAMAPQALPASSPLALTSVEMIWEESQGSRANWAPACCWTEDFCAESSQGTLPAQQLPGQGRRGVSNALKNLHSAAGAMLSLAHILAENVRQGEWREVNEWAGVSVWCVWPWRAWYRGNQPGLHSSALLLLRGWEPCRLRDPGSDPDIWQVVFWFGRQIYQIVLITPADGEQCLLAHTATCTSNET